MTPAPAVSTSPENLPKLQLKKLIDELGETDRLFRLFKPQINPHAARRTVLLSELARRYVKFPAQNQDLQAGAAYQLEVTPCELRHPITPAVKKSAWFAIKALKLDPLESFSITLDAARKALGKVWVKANVGEERTGLREYRVTPLAAAVKAKA